MEQVILLCDGVDAEPCGDDEGDLWVPGLYSFMDFDFHLRRNRVKIRFRGKYYEIKFVYVNCM